MNRFSVIIPVIIFFAKFGAGQTEVAEPGVDYTYFVETEEVGHGYFIYSCYLKNTADSKILFFDFRGSG